MTYVICQLLLVLGSPPPSSLLPPPSSLLPPPKPCPVLRRRLLSAATRRGLQRRPCWRGDRSSGAWPSGSSSTTPARSCARPTGGTWRTCCTSSRSLATPSSRPAAARAVTTPACPSPIGAQDVSFLNN